MNEGMEQPEAISDDQEEVEEKVTLEPITPEEVMSHDYDPEIEGSAFRNKGYSVDMIRHLREGAVEDFYCRRWKEDFDEVRIGYAAFVASREFKQMRRLPPGIKKDMSKREKREFFEYSLEEFKENWFKQSLGIVKVINDLVSKINELNAVDEGRITVEQLMEVVKTRAEEFRFNYEQLYHFRKALELFIKHRELHREYVEKYPDSEDLFEAVFGFRAKGEIKMEHTGISMHFIMDDDEDWRKVNYPYSGNEEEEKRRVESIGGLAFPIIKAEELRGSVSAGRYGRNLEIITVEGELEIHDDVGAVFTSFAHDAPPLEVEVEVKDVGKWKVEEIVEGKNSVGYQVFIFDDEKYVPLLKIKKIVQESKGKEEFFVQKENDPEEKLEKKITVILSKDGRDYGVLVMPSSNKGMVIIKDESEKGSIIKHNSKTDFIETKSDAKTKATAHHESMHHMQHMVNLVEMAHSVEALTDASLKKNNDPAQTLDDIIRDRLRHERYLRVDDHVRNEIGAFYSEGTSLDEIEDIVLGQFSDDEFTSRSAGYDYASIFKRSGTLDRIVKEVKESIETKFSAALFEVKGKDGKPVKAEPVKVDLQRVNEHLESIFGEEYERDVRKMINSVRVLENKGYERGDITYLLLSSPAYSWSSMAYVAPDRTKEIEKVAEVEA